MSYKTKDFTLSKICKHISRILGSDGRRSHIVKEIQSWLTHSGPQWTVDRLRSLRAGVIHYACSELNQNNKTFVFEQEKSWYKKDAYGWPKGPLGKYLKSELTRKDKTYNMDRKLSKVLSILHVSKVIKSVSITPVQMNKYIEAISGNPGRPDIYDYSKRIAHLAMGHSTSEVNEFRKIFQRSYQTSFSFAGLNTSKVLTGFLPPSIRKTHKNKWLLSLLETTYLRTPFTPILKDMGVPVYENEECPSPELVYAGVIKVIQEGNMKGRVVAMPSAGAQTAFKPLHIAISNILRKIPQDCTFNQMNGVNWGAEQLRQGKVMYAVDLSSATDNFPLGFQIRVLEEIGYKYADNFRQFCQMKWGYMDNAFTSPVQYTKGQPMGLYGSFVLFSLSHHIVLLSIQNKLGLQDTYRILGDDIIINNERVYKAYLKVLEDLHVPVSHNKCLVSDFYTEFAGKFISPKGKIPIAKGPSGFLKYGQVDPNQFLNYAEVNGRIDEIITSVPKQYRSYAQRLAELPEYFGGLGFNPKSKSWLERIAKFEEVSKRKGFPELMDLRTTMYELSMQTGHKHIKDVFNFLNEQLRQIELDISASLQGTVFHGIDLHTNLKRLLVQQALEAKDQDNALVYDGVLTNYKSPQSNRNAKNEWLLRSKAIARAVNLRFDNLAKDHPDLSQVTNKDLSQHYQPYTPWM